MGKLFSECSNVTARVIGNSDAAPCVDGNLDGGQLSVQIIGKDDDVGHDFERLKLDASQHDSGMRAASADIVGGNSEHSFEDLMSTLFRDLLKTIEDESFCPSLVLQLMGDCSYVKGSVIHDDAGQDLECLKSTASQHDSGMRAP